MLSDYKTSIIRTITPMVAGFIITWFASKGVTFDEQFRGNLLLILQQLFSALYYIFVRALEAKYPKLGWLLGSPTKPKY